MSEVLLPALGESVTEGTVTRWLKNIGDQVEVDEPLLEISTDKVDTEVPSPFAGVLEEILVQVDETAEVGAVLARIGDGSSQSPSTSPTATDAAETTAVVDISESASPVAAPPAAETQSPTEPVAHASAQTPAASNSTDLQDVVLPALGESVTEGTVTRWLKQIGDSVSADEALLEVSTDKVDTEVPSPVSGILQEILVAEDQVAEVGAVLARIGSGVPALVAPTSSHPAQATMTNAAAEPVSQVTQATTIPAAQPQQVTPSTPAAPSAQAPAAVSVPTASSNYVTPIVRKLAAERGVDLNTISGTGIGGRIRKEDVLSATAVASSAPSQGTQTSSANVTVSELRGTTQPMSRLRKLIAERAVESLQNTAQLSTIVEVDVTRVAHLRDEVKAEFLQKTGTKLSFMPFFALAATEALKSHPVINATVSENNIVYPATENLSFAVDTDRGLLTPVIRSAGDKNIAQLALEFADLAARTRENKLSPDELTGGTFTLTNTGSRGALFDTPLVFLPQSAILGTGAVVKRPAVISGSDGEAIAIRSMVYLALSYDHRIIDGADAARFLTQMKQRLEEGNFRSDLGI